jgi:hypothetical protein
MIFRAFIALSLIGLSLLHPANLGNFGKPSALCGAACDVATGTAITHEAVFRRLNEMREEVRESHKNAFVLQSAGRGKSWIIR